MRFRWQTDSSIFTLSTTQMKSSIHQATSLARTLGAKRLAALRSASVLDEVTILRPPYTTGYGSTSRYSFSVRNDESESSGSSRQSTPAISQNSSSPSPLTSPPSSSSTTSTTPSEGSSTRSLDLPQLSAPEPNATSQRLGRIEPRLYVPSFSTGCPLCNVQRASCNAHHVSTSCILAMVTYTHPSPPPSQVYSPTPFPLPSSSQRPHRQNVTQYSSMTFTCTVEDCGERSTHEFSKRSYENGIVLVQCPGCKNRYVPFLSLPFADYLWCSAKPASASTSLFVPAVRTPQLSLAS